MDQKKPLIPEQPKVERKPNEAGGFYFSGHITIKDPETQQILLKIRSD